MYVTFWWWKHFSLPFVFFFCNFLNFFLSFMFLLFCVACRPISWCIEGDCNLQLRQQEIWDIFSVLFLFKKNPSFSVFWAFCALVEMKLTLMIFFCFFQFPPSFFHLFSVHRTISLRKWPLMMNFHQFSTSFLLYCAPLDFYAVCCR